MESKQFRLEQSMGHWRNKGGNEKISNENIIYENFWNTVKAMLREKLKNHRDLKKIT
jgi:hypothetical protein